MKIEQYKLEKIVTESKEWEVPQEPQYYFETGIRRSVAIIPKWTSWNKEQYNKDEEVFALDIICVYQSFDAKIEKTSINISSINDAYNRSKESQSSIIKFLIDYAHDCKRTKEQFMSDYTGCLESISKVLPLNVTV